MRKSGNQEKASRGFVDVRIRKGNLRIRKPGREESRRGKIGF